MALTRRVVCVGQLTYMLIDDIIKDAIKDGRLFAAKPVVPWAPEARGFLMCPPLHQSIEVGKASDDENERKRWATLEAAISHFVEGGYVTEDLIKQLLDPKYEHWELRSRRPKPSLRVFGRFIQPDIFVGTHLQRRDGLGGMWSPEFEHEKLVCEDHWKAAGLPDPFTAPPDYPYEMYITENATRQMKVPL